MLASKKLSILLTFPPSFAGTERSCSCIDGSCISCSETLVLTYPAQASLCNWSWNILYHHFVFGVVPRANFFQGGHWNILLSTRMRISDFWSWRRIANCFQGLFPLIFVHQYSPDCPGIPNFVQRVSSLLGSRATRAWSLLSPSESLHSKSPFDLVLITSSSERKSLKWLQENIEKLIMLNKQRRRFHSSREKLCLVRMSATLFLVSTNLIWILGSKLILSNNLSDATLWVLDTCLIVGLRPVIIILIRASLSSKMYNWDSPWEECVFVGI